MKSGTLLKGQFLGETAHLGRDDLGRGQANSRSALAINRLFYPQVEFWNVKHLFSFLLYESSGTRALYFRATVWIFQKLKKLNVATLESVKTFVWRVSIVVTMVLISLESAVIIPMVERLSRKVPAQKIPLFKIPLAAFTRMIWTTISYGPYHMDHSLWT